MSQPLPPPIVYQPRPRTKGGNSIWPYVFIAACFTAAVGVLLYAIEANSPRAMLRDVAGKMKANAEKANREHENLIAEAKRAALPSIRAHGIISVGDDMDAIRDNGYWLVGGTGKDRSGALRKFMAQCDRVAFGGDIRWTVNAVVIDGEVVSGEVK